MIQLKTPHGLPVQVPEHDAEDPSKKFTKYQVSEAKDYYEKFGYVVLRNVIKTEDCIDATRLRAEEVKPSSEFVYRQATAKAEKKCVGFSWLGHESNPKFAEHQP
ncbi:MAG: hypothetical protein AAF669_01675 [Pseudomonadota bacterium]